MKNLVMGAVSSNYTVDDIKPWLKSIRDATDNDSTDVILFAYNYGSFDDLLTLCEEYDASIISPQHDMSGTPVSSFLVNTGGVTKEHSHRLVHLIRFYHMHQFLNDPENLSEYNWVLTTDVKDVVFQHDPFGWLDECMATNMHQIVASSEIVTYEEHAWNMNHMINSYGPAIGKLMETFPVHNVGTIAGTASACSKLFLEIYLMAAGRGVADQTGYNILLQGSLGPITRFTDLDDEWAVHLHVINEGHVEFDFKNLDDYCIVHQYDRIPELKKKYLERYG